MNTFRNTTALTIVGAAAAFSLVDPAVSPAVSPHVAPIASSAPDAVTAPATTVVDAPEERRLVRHPVVLANPIQHAKQLFAQDPGHGDPTLSEAEQRDAIAILESAVDTASRDLEEAQARHQASGTTDDEVLFLERRLVLTSMLERIAAFEAGDYVVRDLEKAEAWTGPVCMQVRNYFLRPTGRRQVVVLVDTSPKTPVGRATSLFQEAKASKNS